MKRFFLLSFYTLAISSMGGAAFSQTAAKKTIAVIDFETRGAVSQNEAGTLTDRLRSYLVNTGEFIVVERGKMESILQEQGFQLTGCTSNECAVEIGRILNVQEMITGTVGKIGAQYTIDVRSINIETARILSSITKEFTGDSEGLLDVIELIAHQLAGKVGGLSVVTTPVPASIFVDNRPLGTSPLKAVKVSTGEHALRVVAKDYEPIQQDITIVKDKVYTLTFKLKKKGGNTKFFIAGGAVAAGVITVALLSGGDKIIGKNTTLPAPDGLWPPQK